jgi:hypothetical protein
VSDATVWTGQDHRGRYRIDPDDLSSTREGWGGYRSVPDRDSFSNRETLVAPDGTEVCTLGEPEDRVFSRDLSPLIDRLAATEKALAAAEAALTDLAAKALAFARGAEVRSWPPGHQMRRELIALSRATLDAAAARAALELREGIDRLERDLDDARAREVLLRDVLSVARRFMAAQLLRERAEQDHPGNVEGLQFDEQDALQRLRDTLHETRPALLGAPKGTSR